MHVAVDTNGLFMTQAGVARHLRGLLKGLREVQPPDWKFSSLAWEVENFGYEQPMRALKTVYRELIWAKTTAPRMLRAWRTDLLHSTVSCLVDPPAGVRHVLTIHDLAFLLQPERFRTWQRWTWSRQLKRVPTVDRVICISQFTADEAMRLLELPASKIRVVWNGCDFHPDEPTPDEAAPETLLPNEYFLFVGSLEPGKNLALLKETYALAAARDQRLPPLVIVGARWEGVAKEGKPPHDWHYLGRQPDSVLVYLYRRALALVFPSKYEGFGLPIAEAMALGCPAICSRVASLPEVGGGAVLFAELSPESYLQAMQEVAAHPEFREELIAKGLSQARQFSWRRCAQETIAVYRELH